MDWIKINDKPKSYNDVLLTDGAKQWVGQACENLDIYLASHPDDGRFTKNDCGCAFLTLSKPTHWMPLPEPPKDEG